MALVEYKFLPGIDKQSSDSGAENRWVDSDNVRFRYGLPEKVGGWSSLVTDTIVGVARAMHAFTDLAGNRYVAIGTDKFLLIYFEGKLHDITPLKTTLTSATIATTNGSPTCTITKAAHNLVVGDIVQLDNVTLPGGTGFSNSDFEDKNFQVITVPTTGTFTITQSSNASGTVSTGGSLSLKPYEPVGPRAQTYGYGWGVDGWSAGNWGEAATASDVSLEPGLWSLDNFGQVLIATIANGKTFTWNGGAASSLTNRASTTTTNFATGNNPTSSRVTLVSPTTRHLIHLATETTIGNTTTQDDMFIRFSDQEDINDYAPTAINTAGTQRLQDGTKVVGALKARQETLIWTDVSMHSLQFVGAPFTFGVNLISESVGLIGPKAAINADNGAYWMAADGFYFYNGSVQRLPCSVLNHVYDDMNLNEVYKNFAFTNREFNEVGWFYCSGSSTEPDKYVVFNYLEQVWSIGELSRFSWIDRGIFQYPMAMGKDSNSFYLYDHENGNDADGSPMDNVFIESGDFDLEDGDKFISVREIIPDIRFTGSNGNAALNVVLKTRDFPNDTPTTKVTSSITNTTKKIDTRARARQAIYRIESDDDNDVSVRNGMEFRLGATRFNFREDGRR